jgi:hypothetical protein
LFVVASMALAMATPQEPSFTRDFPLSDCTFATTGRTPYWVLTPGYALTLEGKGTRLVITVLDQVQKVGGVDTRVIEERETENGKLVEVSRNFFAICRENGGVFYFGEDVDIYKDGKITGHEGAWRHGTGGAHAGLMMPGLPLVGSRYYQEVAPGVAMDRAEVTAVGAQLKTPYGALTGVVMTRETTPLEPGASEIKAYAPGIGIVRDADLMLTAVKRP